MIAPWLSRRGYRAVFGGHSGAARANLNEQRCNRVESASQRATKSEAYRQVARRTVRVGRVS